MKQPSGRGGIAHRGLESHCIATAPGPSKCSPPFEGEQRRRFLDRIDEPDKNWKFSLATFTRETLHEYMKAYEDCLNATSSTRALVHRSATTRKCPVHRFPNRPGCAQGTEDGVSKTAAKRRRELKSIRKLLAK